MIKKLNQIRMKLLSHACATSASRLFTISYDTVVSTCVFCSVPDPVMGLREVKRVLKPGGHLLMIEHVRSEQPLVGEAMDLVNHVVRSVMGPNINRHTVDNVRKAGLKIESVVDLGFGDIFKLIVAHKNSL